jgi:hypothetical protein
VQMHNVLCACMMRWVRHGVASALGQRSACVVHAVSIPLSVVVTSAVISSSLLQLLLGPPTFGT